MAQDKGDTGEADLDQILQDSVDKAGSSVGSMLRKRRQADDGSISQEEAAQMFAQEQSPYRDLYGGHTPIKVSFVPMSVERQPVRMLPQERINVPRTSFQELANSLLNTGGKNFDSTIFRRLARQKLLGQMLRNQTADLSYDGQ